MTTIIEKTDSGSSAMGMVLGILLAIALFAGGLYFYNAGGFTHTETNTTTVLPAPAAPQVNITTPAPAAPQVNITAPAPGAPAADSSSSQ